MSYHWEANPHFRAPQQPQIQVPQHDPNLQFPPQHWETNPHFPASQQPQIQVPQHDPNLQFPPQQRLDKNRHAPPPPKTHFPGQPHHTPSSLRMPIVAICSLFWITMILGGLVVLVLHLVFRPQSPTFDISGASLNVAYLDMGYLLNVDITLLANFTNPNKKATVDFHYTVINLYYENTLIATSYVDPFSSMTAESMFQNVRLVSSQVWLPSTESQQLMQQIENNRVGFKVKGLLRTRSNLGFFRYSYWLYGHCIIEVTGPPSGVLVAKKCTTTR
ncbi:hypothetical protein ACSBR1_036884 [Camellia fascicularis]